MSIVNGLDDRREEPIGEHHLLEQAEGEEREPEPDLIRLGLPRLIELGNELGGTHNRSRNQVREEGHEESVIEEATRRLRAPQVHVERVGQRRERVEADADRKDDVPPRRVVDDPDRSRDRHEVLDQEPAIFEVAEHPEVHDDAGQHPRLTGALALRPDHPLRRPPVDHGRHP